MGLLSRKWKGGLGERISERLTSGAQVMIYGLSIHITLALIFNTPAMACTASL